jgi:hypothetical protein
MDKPDNPIQYYDKNGKEIKAGMSLRFSDGSVEQVYETQTPYGNPDLGINASNEAYMRAHDIPEEYREYYPLSNFSKQDIEIAEAPQRTKHKKPKQHER